MERRPVKVRYTDAARSDIRNIVHFIAKSSPAGAKQVRARLREIAENLERNPRTGQITEVPGLRRIVSSPFPYIIFYELKPAEVVIIGVRHGARDPETMPDAP